MSTYVIAGASKGLGLQFVKTYVENPLNTVVGIYRSEGTAGDLLALASSKKNVHAIKADLGSVADLRAAAEATSKVTGGKIDVLINNAAVMDPGKDLPLPTWLGREDELEEHLGTFFHTNATAPVLTTNVFLDLLRRGSAKKIVNISTGMGDPEFSRETELVAPAYAMSKAALNLATISQAVALRSEGFIVFALSPGVVNTRTDAPPTPEQMQAFGYMVKRFQTVYPAWDGVPLTPNESVDQCIKVIDSVTAEQSGQMLSHKGNTEWL